MNKEPVKVLYLVGFGRSGSTILANSLGQVGGFFSAGEICYMWRNNVVENRLCGCGRRFDECPVWTEVMARAFPNGVDAQEMIRYQKLGTRTRHLPLMLTKAGTRHLEGRIEPFLTKTERLYAALREVTGCRVVVDSSKEPGYGHMLGTVPGVDLRVLHLIRDPRAAAFSWLKKKPQPDSDRITFMHRHPPAKSAALWDAWNLSAETFRRSNRYLRVRYEDFVARPRETLNEVLDLVDEPNAEVPLVGEREVKIGISHTVSGNPNRFDTGAVALRPDLEWREKMKPRDRNTVTALTLPLLLRYRYASWSASQPVSRSAKTGQRR